MKRAGKFNSFKAKVAQKRASKDESVVGGVVDYITVQRLASNVEGRYQKYARIGALNSVPLGAEPTLQNIKNACKRYFKCEDMDCDVVAGERGPSWTENSQLTNLSKTVHVRFIERESQSLQSVVCFAQASFLPNKTFKSRKAPLPSKVAASVPLARC